MSKSMSVDKADKWARDIINSIFFGKLNKHFEDVNRSYSHRSHPFGSDFPLSQKGIGKILQFCINAVDVDEGTLLEKITAIREDKESDKDYIAKWKISATEYSGHLAGNIENDLKYARVWYDGFKAGKSWGMISEENSEKENIQE